MFAAYVYDWHTILYDLDVNIPRSAELSSRNNRISMHSFNQHDKRRLFEDIYKHCLDDIRALYRFDTEQRNANIHRLCICWPEPFGSNTRSVRLPSSTSSNLCDGPVESERG